MCPALKTQNSENIENEAFKSLCDISSIDITLNFEDILHNILKISCETIKAHSGTMMLVDEESGELRMVASYGLPSDYIERVYKAAEDAGMHLTSSPSGTVLKTGKYYLVPNIFEEPKDKPWYHLARELGFSSQIFTPMKRGLKVIGLLNIYWEKTREFKEDEINFVTIAASQASSVVQNARLCSRLRNNIKELDQYKRFLEEKIKEAHRKLYDSEKYLRTIIESSPNGIAIIDEKGRCEFGNDSVFRIIGWPKEDIIGNHFMKVIPEDTKDFMLKKWEEIQKVIEKPYETKIITKKGEIRYIQVSHAITEMNGNRKYVVIFSDVTEKKKIEQRLKQSYEKLEEMYERLRQADAFKTELITNITHELFTPLTSIKGFAELIHSEEMGTLNHEQKKSLEIILRNCDRVISLIQNLLDVEHIEKNKIELRFKSVFNEIIQRLIQDLQPHIIKKHITIVKNIPPLPRIQGDEERLTQAITNVLSNAVKYTPENGTITITAKEEADEIKISIADTGIGIPKDKLERIFDRFYKVNGANDSGGTGIGLSICRGIIEKHKGLIWAESKGNGSTFHIVLPKKI